MSDEELFHDPDRLIGELDDDHVVFIEGKGIGHLGEGDEHPYEGDEAPGEGAEDHDEGVADEVADHDEPVRECHTGRGGRGGRGGGRGAQGGGRSG